MNSDKDQFAVFERFRSVFDEQFHPGCHAIDLSDASPEAVEAMGLALEDLRARRLAGQCDAQALAWLREVLEAPEAEANEPYALHLSRRCFRDRVLAVLWKPMIAVPEAAYAYGSYKGSDERERVRLRVVLWQDLSRLQKAIRGQMPGLAMAAERSDLEAVFEAALLERGDYHAGYQQALADVLRMLKEAAASALVTGAPLHAPALLHMRAMVRALLRRGKK